MRSTDLELAYLPAHRQVELFRARHLSPVEVLKAQIDRISAVNSRINALTYDHLEDALQAASDSERRYRRGDARALEGVTVAVKDEYEKAGWRVTAGSALFQDQVSSDTHPVLDKLMGAGAIPHVQTTAPELFLVAVTWSDLWGVTHNPWNLDCTPGGSSGGSAAALAAGMASLAIGSDMGGSIRIPCALTGLYGSKPAYGRIASPDPSALVPHASPGPLARNLRDLLLLQNLMVGPAPGCPAVVPDLHVPFDPAASRCLKVALSIDQGWATIAPDVRANTVAAARLLEAEGVIVDEVSLDLETTDAALRQTIEQALFSSALGADLIEHAPDVDRMTTYGRRFVDVARGLGPVEAKKAAEEALRFYRVLERSVFERGYDALITPTVSTTQVPAGFDPTRDRLAVNGREVDPYAGWFLTSVFSLLNWMPVINVPTGQAANDVPTGMQIVTRPYDDVTAAIVAARYAEAAEPIPFETTACDAQAPVDAP